MEDRIHPAAWDERRLLAQCKQRYGRASGPGGQNRNKVETAVVLLHTGTGVEAQASERRSQAENLRVALRRLRVHLALGVRTPIDPVRGPSDLWRSRLRQSGRIALNPDHHDAPAMIAEALDALAACDWDAKRAAAFLGCTATQLVRMLADEPRALAMLNDQRKQRGRRPYL